MHLHISQPPFICKFSPTFHEGHCIRPHLTIHSGIISPPSSFGFHTSQFNHPWPPPYLRNFLTFNTRYIFLSLGGSPLKAKESLGTIEIWKYKFKFIIIEGKSCKKKFFWFPLNENKTNLYIFNKTSFPLKCVCYFHISNKNPR